MMNNNQPSLVKYAITKDETSLLLQKRTEVAQCIIATSGSYIFAEAGQDAHTCWNIQARSGSYNLFVQNILVSIRTGEQRKRDGYTYMSIEEMVITEIQPINLDWTNLQQEGQMLQLNIGIGMNMDFMLLINISHFKINDQYTGKDLTLMID